MKNFLAWTLCALLGAGCVARAAENSKGAPSPAPSLAGLDATELEYLKLIEGDEQALEEVERWVNEYKAFEAQGAAGPKSILIAKIEQRFEGVKKEYDDFLQRHPKHVKALLAYGSFLSEIDEDEGAITHWEKAREIDPKNPSAWNNLANIYGHVGPVKKAFQYYAKAMELDPAEPVYVHNLATSVYLFRKDAAETYRIDETAVFDKALDLYRQAMRLDPTNLVLATDFAQSYYGIRPLRADDAVGAWNHALTLAKNDGEKEGIYLHLARVNWMADRLDETEKNLGRVSQPEFAELKKRITRNLERKRSGKEPAADEKEVELPKDFKTGVELRSSPKNGD